MSKPIAEVTRLNKDEGAVTAAAARALDAFAPGWALKIKVDRLDMESREDCILGQLFGEKVFNPFMIALKRLITLQAPYIDATGVFASPQFLPYWVNEVGVRRLVATTEGGEWMTVSETLQAVPGLIKQADDAVKTAKLTTEVLVQQDREIDALKQVATGQGKLVLRQQRRLTDLELGALDARNCVSRDDAAKQFAEVKESVAEANDRIRLVQEAATASIAQVAITAEKVDSKLAERITKVEQESKANDHELGRQLRDGYRRDKWALKLDERTEALEATNLQRDALVAALQERLQRVEQRFAQDDAKAAVKAQVWATLNDINTCGPAPWEATPDPVKPLDWGVLVEYLGHPTAIASTAGWRGHVIPRPADAPQFGMTGREFVWVLNTSGNKPSYHGAVPENLRRL